MSFLKKFLGNKPDDSIPLQPTERCSQLLPEITKKHIHKRFGKYSEGPIPGKGGKMLKESIEAWNKGDFDKSFELKEAAIDAGLEGPDRSLAYSGLGQIYVRRGQLREAVDNFLKCLEIPDRGDDACWQSAMRLYYIYSEVGRSSEAFDLLSLAKEANKTLNWAHAAQVEHEVRRLAREYLSTSDGSGSKEPTVQEIIAHAEKLGIRIVPQEEEDVRNKAESMIKKSSEYLVSEPKKAIDLLDQVLETFPNHYGAYINRGIAYDHLGDYEKAIQDYRHSIRINPNYYIAHINLASLYEKLGDKAKALKLYNEVLSIIPPTREADVKQVRRMISELEQTESTVSSDSKIETPTDKNNPQTNQPVYVCDICGNIFSRARLDEHFAETAKQAAEIKGVTWSGKLVTFDVNGKAWCPHCFKDANSMRSGTRTVHEGVKNSYLRPPNIEFKYQCKCGRDRTFNFQSVSIYTGAEVECGMCGQILCVPPTVFDHSKPSLIGESSLRSDYKEQMTFVKCSKSELDQQFTKGIITEQEYKEKLKRRGF